MSTFPFGNSVAVWLDLATVIDPVAVNTPVPTAALTATPVCLVTESPAGLVTVRVKTVLAVRTLVGTQMALVTGPRLLSMLPVPPLKTPRQLGQGSDRNGGHLGSEAGDGG